MKRVLASIPIEFIERLKFEYPSLIVWAYLMQRAISRKTKMYLYISIESSIRDSGSLAALSTAKSSIMDYNFLGNSANSYDLPVPPENRINITVITGSSGVKAGLISANDDPLISKYARVNVVTSVDDMPASLVTEDIIMLEMLSSDWISSAKELSTEAMEQNNATVLTLHTSLLEDFGNVDNSSAEYSTIGKYWQYKGDENMILEKLL